MSTKEARLNFNNELLAEGLLEEEELNLSDDGSRLNLLLYESYREEAGGNEVKFRDWLELPHLSLLESYSDLLGLEFLDRIEGGDDISLNLGPGL